MYYFWQIWNLVDCHFSASEYEFIFLGYMINQKNSARIEELKLQKVCKKKA